MARWSSEFMADSSLPAWVKRQVSFSAVSRASAWCECLMIATLCPRRFSSAMSFSSRVVFPELDFPTIDIIERILILLLYNPSGVCYCTESKRLSDCAHPEPVEGRALMVRQAHHERVIEVSFSIIKH